MAFNRARSSLLGLFILLFSHSHIIAASKPYFDISEVVTFDTQNCNHKATRPDGTMIDQETSLRTAFGDANLLAHAGVNAAAKPHDPPFSYYFHPEDNETVVENLQMVIALTEDPKSFGTVAGMVWGGGGKVALNCNQQQWCRLKNQWGYSQVWQGETRHKQWEVTICDYGLNIPDRNPPACTGSVGVPSLGWVALKYLIQMWDIRDQIGLVGNYAFGPKECNALLTKKDAEPSSNAESYAYMSSSAYDLGMKNDGPYHGPACPDRWNPSADVLLPPWAAEGTTDRHAGLDKL